MHVVLATDGSQQSLAAAEHLLSFADAAKITDLTIVDVLSPLAAVPFADEISTTNAGALDDTFAQQAARAVAAVADIFDGWGPTIHRQLRSGSPANEIVKVAQAVDAGLVVVASGSGGLSETVLLGSTAQRVQHSAPCPVLVVRPSRRKQRR